MLSLRQLAKLAGVSPATAYRALNGLANVSAPTREHILRLADEHHYVPLRRLSSRMACEHYVIGFIVPSLSSLETTWVVKALVEQGLMSQTLLHTFETFSRLNRTIDAVQQCMAIPVDGIYMHSGLYWPLPSRIIQRLHEQRIPLVTRDVAPTELPVDWVGHDENAIGEMAVQYLTELGHRDIAAIGDICKGITGGRPLAVKKALESRGLSTDNFLDAGFISERDQQVWRHQLTALLRSPSRPTAIIALGHIYGMVALQAVRHVGLHVPHDFSVLGTGNNRLDAFAFPPLTTIEQSEDDVPQAIALLFERIARVRRSEPYEAKRITVDAHLVIRKSCAPPPIHV